MLVLTALTTPATALGSAVKIEGGSLIYTADAGEVNSLDISDNGPDEYDVSDGGATITPGPGCAPGGFEVRCTGSITAISIDVAYGADSVFLEFPTPLQSSIAGGAGDDMLTGHSGNDAIDGGDDQDGLYGLGAGDSLEGGGGDDRIRGDEPFEFTPPGVVGIAGNDVVSGGAGNDRVDGDDGDDTVTGGEGNDSYGAATAPPSFCSVPPPCPAPSTNGADIFSGGPGRDIADFSIADDALAVSLDDIQNDGEPGERDNIRADVEDVVGGSGGDTLIGNAADNLLDGGDGNDRTEGLGGNDVLRGGEGDVGSDNLDGGDGNDALDGGPSDDELIGSRGNDTLDGDSGQDNIRGGAGSDLVQGGPGSDPSVAGDAGDDRVYGANEGAVIGGDGNDTITGGTGDDSLSGGPANDTLDGAAGSDLLGGGEGADTALYRRDARVRLTLDGRKNDGQTGERDNVAEDVESAEGGTSQDDLVGNARSNTLASGEGEDYVDGGVRGDTLLGGTAGDVIRSETGSWMTSAAARAEVLTSRSSTGGIMSAAASESRPAGGCGPCSVKALSCGPVEAIRFLGRRASAAPSRCRTGSKSP